MSRKYSWAMLLGALAGMPPALLFIGANFWPQHGWLQPNGFYLGSDFANYWTGGRLALMGQASELYNVATYNEVLRAWFSPDIRMMNFSYPPTALLMLAAFGALPYFAALTLWTAAGSAGFAAAALGQRWRSTGWPLAAALALAPVLWANIVFGQMGLWLAVLLVGALRALPTRPFLAGALLGLLTIKPQLGLLLPLVLLATGAWRAITAAVVTTLVMAALSLVLFGAEPWRAYVTETLPFQWQFVERMNGFYRFQMITPYTTLHFLGVSTQAALACQLVVSTVIAAVTLLIVRGGAPWALKCAAVTFGSVLVVPYMLAYDLAAPYAALVWHLIDDHPAEDRPRLVFTGVLWSLPLALAIAVQIAGIPLLPVALLAGFFWLAGDALGWRPVTQLHSAFASLRA